MPPTRNSDPGHPHLASPIKITTKFLITFTLASLALCLFATPSLAQGSLSLGTLGTSTALPSCPGNGWYSYTNPNTSVITPMNCVASSIQGCSNAQNMNFTYGYLSPVGLVSTVTASNVSGVVVYFTGGDGLSPVNNTMDPTQELNMLGYYFTRGYEIVQLAWSTPWEATYDPFPGNTFGNIQNAACRPATFLNYVDQSIYIPLAQPKTGNPNAGMCAQGESAGSAAVAYSMTYYGAASYLDNVELISGPVLSDIGQGCQTPAGPEVTVCPINQQTQQTQYGCQLGGDQPWTLSPTYLSGANGGVRNWTNDPTCANALPITTSQQSEARWLAQSIVDQSTGAVGAGAIPNYNYPNGMSGWLCRTLKNGDTQAQCAANYDSKLCPNNSSPQGELFYAQITSSNSPQHYAVYSVDDCDGPEGSISNGSSVPGYKIPGSSGYQAITYDMAGAPPPVNVSAQCTHPTPH